MKLKKTKLLATASMAVLLVACSTSPESLNQGELSLSAQSDYKLMFGENEEISDELTLSDAIARALKYNLDHRAKTMEHALAMRQTDLDKLELLPTLTANAGYTHTSEYDATNSQTVGSSTAPGSYSYSAQKGSKTADLTMGWNLLDFGVSYYNSKQNGNRALIAEERRRKVIHNLVKEVQAAYWRMVATQKLESRVKIARLNAQKALGQAERIELERVQSPEKALRYQKRLLQNSGQLEAMNQQLSTARFELAALINVKPGTNFRVAIPASDTLNMPEWNASVEDMEQLAFQNNPDLREKIYMTRIAVDETKKSIASLLPGLDLGYGRNYDGNSFRDENRWFEFSTSLSFNLFNVFKIPARQEYGAANEKLAQVQRLALRMALLAQVHVADRKYHNAVRKFEQAEKMYSVDKRLSSHVSKRAKSNSQGVLETISQETAAIGSELRRYQAYSEVMAAVGRIHSTLGIGIIPKGMTASDVQGVSDAVSQAMADWRNGTAINKEVQNLKEVSITKPTAIMNETPVVEENVAEKQSTKVVKAPVIEEKVEPKTVEKPSATMAKPIYVDYKLNDAPGKAPVTKASLNCATIKEGSVEMGWIEISGQNTKGNNMNGWVHQIYLMQNKLQCKNLAAVGS